MLLCNFWFLLSVSIGPDDPESVWATAKLDYGLVRDIMMLRSSMIRFDTINSSLAMTCSSVHCVLYMWLLGEPGDGQADAADGAEGGEGEGDHGRLDRAAHAAG